MEGKKLSKGKLFYYVLRLLIPFIILLINKLVVINDIVLVTFLVLTVTIYLFGIHFTYKILEIRNEFIRAKDSIQDNNALNDFEKISEVINNEDYNYLKQIFKGYKKTLRRIEEVSYTGEKIEKDYATLDANEFFDEENVIYGFIKYKTLNYITQSLTGIGIFGTFLGIVKGVSGLNMTDTEAMTNGINTLLMGVKTSFNTSLYGILFSVVLTFAVKIVIDYTMKSCREFCDIVDDSLLKSTDKEGFKEIEYELKKQTNAIQQLAATVIEEMGKRFQDSMEQNILGLTDEIRLLIDNMSTKIVDSNQVAAQTIGNSIIPAVSQLQEVILKIQDTQKDSNTEFIESSISAVKETVNIGIENEVIKLKETMKEISVRNEEMLNTFSLSMSNMQDLTKHQESLIKNTNTSTESINYTTNNIKELQESLLLAINGMKEVNQDNNVSIENVQSTIESMKDSMINQVKINESIEQMIKKSYDINMSQNRFIETLDKISKSIEINMQNTNNYISNLTNEIGLYKGEFSNIKDSTLEISKNLEYKYKNIIQDLSTVNTNLSKTVESVDERLINKVNGMSDGLENIVKQIKDYQMKNELLINRIEGFSEVEKSTQDTWKSYQDSFEELNLTITQSVQDYNKHINDGVSEVLNNYDKYVSQAINGLKTVIEKLDDTVEEMNEGLEIIVGSKGEKHNAI